MTTAQAVPAALFVTLPVLLPLLERRFDLGIRAAGLLLASVNLGMTLTLVAWGRLADGLGERVVLVTGLSATGLALAGAAFAPSLPLLLVALTAVGLFGASVNAASTRAALSWFEPRERGLALAIRQTSIPLGGAGFALLLPGLARGTDSELPFLTLAGFALAAAAAAGVFVRRRAALPGDATAAEMSVVRNRHVWRICASAAAMLVGQSTIVGFSVLFLHESRGLSTAAAAGTLAACQLAGAGVLLAVGRLSDRLGRRVQPLRRLGYLGGATLLVLAAAVHGPRALLLPALVVSGGVSFGWVALSSAAAGESVHPSRTGAASGLQQSAMAISATLAPLVMALLIGAAGWQASFGLAAVGPLVGAAVLIGLREPGRATHRAEAETLGARLEGSAP